MRDSRGRERLLPRRLLLVDVALPATKWPEDRRPQMHPGPFFCCILFFHLSLSWRFASQNWQQSQALKKSSVVPEVVPRGRRCLVRKIAFRRGGGCVACSAVSNANGWLALDACLVLVTGRGEREDDDEKREAPEEEETREEVKLHTHSTMH